MKLMVLLALTSAFGCVPERPKDPSELPNYCAGEARSAMYVDEKPLKDAMAIYAACMKGLPYVR
jgi:hypothetical protein